MVVILIKYFFIIFCLLYFYMKLLNITQKIKIYLYLVPFLIFVLPTIYIVRKYAAPFSIFIIIILFALFVNSVLKTPLRLSFTVSVISFGIIYSAFLVSALLVSSIGSIFEIYLNKLPSDILSMIFIGIIQFSIITFPFRLHRLKNGMTFIQENDSNDIGVYISILILLTASFLSIREKTTLILIIPLFIALLSGLSILFWWRNSLTKRYLKKIKAMEIEELQKNIQEKNEQIEKLKFHNDELSSIIHKDNKLIPSLEYAIREYLLSATKVASDKDLLLRGKELLSQLESVSQERAGILNNYELLSKKLVLTNLPTVDILLSYMFQKAKEYRINFDVTISGNMLEFVDYKINESDLRTLLADLIDNAISASKRTLKRNILINMNSTADIYFIDIFDSGELFHEEILLNLGIKRTTTHAIEGGSGIGLMTIFEIIKKYKASFMIEEFLYNNLFTKKVSISFDTLGQIRIKTMRTDIKISLAKHTDIILIPYNEKKYCDKDITIDHCYTA